jgi:hypothetical protein
MLKSLDTKNVVQIHCLTTSPNNLTKYLSKFAIYLYKINLLTILTNYLTNLTIELDNYKLHIELN